MKRRKNGRGRYSGISIFSSRIKCADCGEWYGSKVWHSNDEYRRIIYRCNHKYRNGSRCQTPHVTEDEIKAGFVKAFNELTTEKEEIIGNIREMQKMLCNTGHLEEEKRRLEGEMSVLIQMTQDIIEENARVAQDQESYQRRYSELIERYEDAKSKRDTAASRISAQETKRTRLNKMVKELRKKDGAIDEFDESLWCCLIDHVEISRRKDMKFVFQDGTEITV